MVIYKIKVHVTKSARYLPDIWLLNVEEISVVCFNSMYCCQRCCDRSVVLNHVYERPVV